MIKNNLILLFLLLIFAGHTKAQTGTLIGKGMSVCADFSFTICPPQVISPLGYYNEPYKCDSNTVHECISFVPQGSAWRVEFLSWRFAAAGTSATVSGINTSGNPISYTFAAGDTLKPFSDTIISGVGYVVFYINNAPIGSGFMVKKSNFQISLTAAPLVPYFMLGTTATGLQGSSATAGTHTWKVYRVTDCSTGPYTLLGAFNTQNFSIDSPGPCYYVTHQMSTSCGEVCAAQFICASTCDEKECNLSVPEGLKVFNDGSGDLLTWSPVPGAVSYTIEIKVNDPECCEGENVGDPIVIGPITATSYALDFSVFNLQPDQIKCYSWRVIAVCPDGGRTASAFQCSTQVEGKVARLGIKGQQAENTRVTVYPNPTDGLISIDVAEVNTDFSIEILDMSGKTVKTFKKVRAIDKRSMVKWNAGSLKSGQYLVKITTTDNQVFTRKFIKE